MKDLRILRCAIVMLLGLGMSTRPSAAQGVTTALITGVVKDSQGAVVPGATVSATNEATGVSHAQTTTNTGLFAFPAGITIIARRTE